MVFQFQLHNMSDCIIFVVAVQCWVFFFSIIFSNVHFLLFWDIIFASGWSYVGFYFFGGWFIVVKIVVVFFCVVVGFQWILIIIIIIFCSFVIFALCHLWYRMWSQVSDRKAYRAFFIWSRFSLLIFSLFFFLFLFSSVNYEV